MKMPPREKVPEAWSAIADGRVAIDGGTLASAGYASGSATVRNSSGEKDYSVRWDGDTFASSDSATYWQGYPGYPVIAVLMETGRLPLDREMVGLFAGVNWNELNKRHKRDYAAALDEVLDALGQDVTDPEKVQAAIDTAMDALSKLDLVFKRKL